MRCVLLLCLLIVGCDRDATVQTPVAKERPVTVSIGGQSWTDPYAYLADADDPDTRAYLAAEQSYFDEQVASLSGLQREIAAELNRALPVSRQTRPVRIDDHMVYARVPSGSQYRVYERYPVDDPAAVQTLLDTNDLAGGADYYALGGFAVNDHLQLIAYTEDTSGDQNYTLHIRTLAGAPLASFQQPVDADLVWLGNQLIFTRAGCVYALVVNTAAALTGMAEPEPLVCRDDPAFHLSLARLGDLVAVTARAQDTTHVTLLMQDGRVIPFTALHEGHSYSLRLHKSQYHVLTNWRTADYELAVALPGQSPDDWHYLSLPGEGQLIDVEPVGDLLAVHRRHRLRDSIYLDSGELIEQAGPAEALQLRRASADDRLEFVRRGWLHPDYHVLVDLKTHSNREGVQVSAGSSVDASKYQVEQRWYPLDGIEVPVTLVYGSGLALDEQPLLLTVYGAYGLSPSVEFDVGRLPLLERGFILGLVHVRGGGALGPAWHEAGRGRSKINAFNDFIGVTDALQADGVGAPGRVAARATSAGATVIAVAANRRPDLYRAMLARVPYVDVLNSLLDDEQLLTPSDRLEWGDPNDADILALLRSYSPYDNVRRQSYPAMLVTAAANDVRVPAYEAVKWMARLRNAHEGDHRLLLNLQDGQGHLGATDQYDRRQARALEIAFLLRELAAE